MALLQASSATLMSVDFRDTLSQLVYNEQLRAHIGIVHKRPMRNIYVRKKITL